MHTSHAVNTQPRTPAAILSVVAPTDHVALVITNQRTTTPDDHITETLRAIFRSGLRIPFRLTPRDASLNRHICGGERILAQHSRTCIRITSYIRVVSHRSCDAGRNVCGVVVDVQAVASPADLRAVAHAGHAAARLAECAVVL